MTEIEQINLTIEDARNHISKLDALDRLRLNRDFKAIIEEDYFVNEASRLVLALADPALQTEDKQKQLHQRIIAIGFFRQYLSGIYQTGNQAKMALESHEQTRNELMSEAL